jgi:hypothetical protein
MFFFPIAHTRLLKMYSPAWPHSEIKAIFPAIFYVTGTNITTFNNTELQHSRNMIIIRENGKLSLINTVRLDEKGLAALEALGDVENIIRIGAFHGRDDCPACNMTFYSSQIHSCHLLTARYLFSKPRNIQKPFCISQNKAEF